MKLTPIVLAAAFALCRAFAYAQICTKRSAKRRGARDR